LHVVIDIGRPDDNSGGAKFVRPLPKLFQVSLPAFALRAMENPILISLL